MLKRCILVLVFSIAAAFGVDAQRAAPAAPVRPSDPAPPRASHAAFVADRLARIDAVFQRYVEEGRIGGAVALVLQDGRAGRDQDDYVEAGDE